MVNLVKEGRFMRLYNIYYICKNARISTSEIKTETFKSSGVDVYKITNWLEFRDALEALLSIRCLHDAVENTFSSVPLFVRSRQVPEVSNAEFSELSKGLEIVNQKLDAIIDLYESMGLEGTKVGLEIKVPQTDRLSDYIDILRDLDFVFEQCPYCRTEDEQLKFSGTDVGSSWLTFGLISTGTYYILNNIAKLIDKGIAIKSHFATYKMQEEALESMRQKNAISQEVIDTFQDMKKLAYKQYVEELSNEITPTKDGEEEAKVEKSLEKMASLIDKGVEIYTSIETPKEVKVLFPFEDKREALTDSLMKYLEEKATGGEGETK